MDYEMTRVPSVAIKDEELACLRLTRHILHLVVILD